MRAATAEQHRIGQELHDGPLQDLTGLGLLAQNLADSLTEPELARQKQTAARIAAGIAETNRQLRNLAEGLVPVPVDAEGLMMALEQLARRTEITNSVSTRFVCPKPVRIQDDGIAMHMYRIAQEAVTNAIRHSMADTISIYLERRNNIVQLKINDNGRGIEPGNRRRAGLGLPIMEHRCGLIGGTLSVGRQDSGGTSISCKLPTPPES